MITRIINGEITGFVFNARLQAAGCVFTLWVCVCHGNIYNHLAPCSSSRIDFGVALFSSFLLSNQYSWTSSFRGVIRGFTLPHKPIDSIDWSAVNREEEFDGPKSFDLPQIQFFLTIIVSQSLCQSISQISPVLIGLSGISYTTIDIWTKIPIL